MYCLLLLLLPQLLHAEAVVSVGEKDLLPTAPEVSSLTADPRAKIMDDLNQASAEPQNIGVVLDSSGSMGAILEKNRTKMFFLKKLMKSFVSEQWKLKNNIGVRVYGSKQKSRCDDIQTPIPYSDRSLGKLEKALEQMAPLGMTPLHKSLQMSVDEIKNKPGPKKILVVTDGEDTCGGDPCKTAEEVKKQNLDITFYVIALGFNGPSDDLKKVSCIGDVHVANDSESFSDAVSQISSKINGGQNLKVISPDPSAPVYLYKLAGEKRILERVFYASSEQTVPPGEYEAVVGLKPAYKFAAFKILPGRKVTLKVEGEGQVIVNFFGGHARAEILDKNNKVVTKFRSDETVKVPTGKWRLRIFKNPFFEIIIPNYFVFPNGEHSYDLASVGVIKVDTPELQGIYVYDQDNKLIDHSLTKTALLLRSGIYSIHVNEKCTFPKVEVRDRKEVVVLSCREH